VQRQNTVAPSISSVTPVTPSRSPTVPLLTITGLLARPAPT